MLAACASGPPPTDHDPAGLRPHGDVDRDGVPDLDDGCPHTPGIRPRGCPEADRDHDGLADSEDPCPDVATPDPRSCKPLDTDEDGVPDSDDQCVTEPEIRDAFANGDGCPNDVPPEFTALAQAPLAVKFRGRELSEASHEELDRVAGILRKIPRVCIAVRVHSDASGSTDHNKAFTKSRAEAVIAFLFGRGVDRRTLVPVGVGEDEPEVSEDGKSRARERVEFVAVDHCPLHPAPSEAVYPD